MLIQNSEPRIIIALDFPDADTALSFVKSLDPAQCRLKVGFELFVAAGPTLIEALQTRGFEVFLDLKFHDIPNTVAGACRTAAALGVWMINVHASGGRRMMEAAREALEGEGKRPLLIAVTVLTSMDDAELEACGIGRGVDEQARFLAGLTQESGLDGVVCSAREAPVLRQELGTEFLKVTPGIRPRGSEAGDQKRIVTPADAIRDGATHLVIGRPITRAQDPSAVLAAIHQELLGLET
ncbi:orotidine-5'-phosphate decarboxylase [Ectothiorhodospira variabilis]|uniref:orotidine-5'-phosphate decarboxylase n=1 Tax=Ectothiorhodospira variabilis TaxID=505694 RepID=UPI001EFBA80C|nr:orotidine-5'-phosphate decarboxylase [Ectothiorhodospira variabilis]MCG5495071.1 orotidine-5'-phosphate decarboxylase [Ectothiorhodospira variabilis]MCG5504658.1 orotidine-5'-phosphate decarboxylase [Ectothiorhodospira variabilis]MCG5507789.1 orotidine-5'-phosphate decarboxylase [Ectothiorhodospira variabilis]